MKVAMKNGRIVLAQIEQARMDKLKKTGCCGGTGPRVPTPPPSRSTCWRYWHRFSRCRTPSRPNGGGWPASPASWTPSALPPSRPPDVLPGAGQTLPSPGTSRQHGADPAFQQAVGRFGLLFEMGCGKTLTAVAIMGALYRQRKITRVLVVAPSSVCSVWPHDLAALRPSPMRYGCCWGRKSSGWKPCTA